MLIQTIDTFFFTEEGDLKPKKGNKKILLTEQREEIDILKQENEELRKSRVNYKTHIDELKKELESNKTAIDKLKQELHEEKTTNDSLQTRNDKEKADYTADVQKLNQELGNSRAVIDKLKQELDVEITTNKSLQIRNDKVKADYIKAISDKIKPILEKDKATINTLQVSDNRLRRELQISNDKFVETSKKYRATLETLEKTRAGTYAAYMFACSNYASMYMCVYVHVCMFLSLLCVDIFLVAFNYV